MQSVIEIPSVSECGFSPIAVDCIEQAETSLRDFRPERRVGAGVRGAALSSGSNSIAVAYLLLLSHRVRDFLPCCVPRRVGHTTRPTTRTRQASAGRPAGSTGRIKGWKTYCCGRALKVIAFATGFCASSERAVRASGRDHTGFVASPLAAAAGHTALAAGRFLDSRTAFGGKFCLERVDLPAGSI